MVFEFFLTTAEGAEDLIVVCRETTTNNNISIADNTRIKTLKQIFNRRFTQIVFRAKTPSLQRRIIVYFLRTWRPLRLCASYLFPE